MDDVEYIDPETIGGVNLFAYCNNNPVMQVDETGNMPKWLGWLISGVEVVTGIALCFVPGFQGVGATVIGTGVGSLINGYMTEANGGTFGAGWVGGQVAGLAPAIPIIGSVVGPTMGPIAGSIVTDAIDYGLSGIDPEKAILSGVLAWGIGIFPSTIGTMLEKLKIHDSFSYLINAYNSIISGIGSSMVNVFWRGNNNGK